MNNAFLRSYECLHRVYVDGAFSTIELNRLLNTVSSTDKPVITKLVYGVLENDILLDYVVSQFVTKSKGDSKLMLKMGTYCLMNLSIPPYAVVNDMAELAKITGDKRIVGFVNATLKNISTAVNYDTIQYPTDKLELLSVKYSYPMWALLKLVKDYGIDSAEKIISQKLSHDTTIRINTDAISIDNFIAFLEDMGIAYTRTILDDCIAVSGMINIDERLYTPMSLSSMLIARSVPTSSCSSVLDTCSAPGGKAVYIKQLCNTVSVTACELHPHRVELIDSYASRMGVDIQTVCCDSTVFNDKWESQFDSVLCDVPCSGFGVVDSRPDIKLFRQNKDIGELKALQYAILDNCSKYVKVGGTLIYSTCTLFANENQDNINKFIKTHDNFVMQPLQLSYFDAKCSYQFLPHIDNMQAFYIASIKRIK